MFSPFLAYGFILGLYFLFLVVPFGISITPGIIYLSHAPFVQEVILVYVRKIFWSLSVGIGFFTSFTILISFDAPKYFLSMIHSALDETYVSFVPNFEKVKTQVIETSRSTYLQLLRNQNQQEQQRHALLSLWGSWIELTKVLFWEIFVKGSYLLGAGPLVIIFKMIKAFFISMSLKFLWRVIGRSLPFIASVLCIRFILFSPERFELFWNIMSTLFSIQGVITFITFFISFPIFLLSYKSTREMNTSSSKKTE